MRVNIVVVLAGMFTIANYLVLKLKQQDDKNSFSQVLKATTSEEVLWSLSATLVFSVSLFLAAIPFDGAGKSAMGFLLLAVLPFLFVTKSLLRMNIADALTTVVHTGFIAALFWMLVLFIAVLMW